MDVLREAEAILISQHFVPESPAEFDANGRVCLCAAGILAKAGLLLADNDGRINNFELDLARTKSRDLLFSAFDSLGWSATLCADMIRENDATDSARRKEVIHARLRTLQGTQLSAIS
jgi:hypothetical protein